MTESTDKKEAEVQKALAPVSQRNLPILSERFQPRNLTELMSWAKLVTSSGLAPKGMNESGVVLCVQMGADLNISPPQAIQNIAVINGRPSIFGDLGLAIFKRDAAFKSFEEDAPDVALKQGYGRCKITMKNGDVVERRFSVEEAKTAKLWGKSGPWTDYPGRMLMFRARWWAMRDADGGVFKGVAAGEEVYDVTPDGIEYTRPRARAPEGEEAAGGFEQVDSFVDGVGNGRPAAGVGGRPAPSTPAAPKDGLANPYVGTIKEVKKRTGKNAKGTWTLYRLIMQEEGVEFSTFSESVLQQVKETARDELVQVSWEQKGQYLTATAVHPNGDAAEPAASPEAEQGDEVQENLWSEQQ